MNINGVILTDKAIEQLRIFQDEENDLLRGNINFLTGIVELISNDMPSSDSDAKRNLIFISGLFAICNQFKCLFAKDEGD
jgi:hypothetical protein